MNHYLLLIPFLLLIFLLPIAIKRRQKHRRIKTWIKHLNLDKHQAVFHQIYRDIDGFSLSKEARKKQDAMEYVYGEIEFLPFVALLSLIELDMNSVFYDLGSGTGKAVFACAMSFTLKKCCGIEIFSNLHQAACQQLEKLEHLPKYHPKTKDIHFYHQNFLEQDLSEATVIFVNATAIMGESWEKLNHTFDALTTCRTIITTSKPLSSSRYQCLQTSIVEMSWGPVRAFIHQRFS